MGRSFEWCQGGAEITKHNGIYIFNRDRTRFNVTRNGVPLNWLDAPQPLSLNGTVQDCCKGMGPPLTMDFNILQSANNAPVTADVDGDGVLETFYASYDGQIHCWWADKSEKYRWPVRIGTSALCHTCSFLLTSNFLFFFFFFSFLLNTFSFFFFFSPQHLQVRHRPCDLQHRQSSSILKMMVAPKSSLLLSPQTLVRVFENSVFVVG